MLENQMRISRIVAIVALGSVTMIGFVLTSYPHASAYAAYASDSVTVDADEPRQELGYERYRVQTIDSDRYHVEVDGLNNYWGDIMLELDEENIDTWIRLESWTNTDSVEIEYSIVGGIALVRVNDQEVVYANINSNELELLSPIEPSNSLRMLWDVLHDENIREELGGHESALAVTPLIPLGLLACAHIYWCINQCDCCANNGNASCCDNCNGAICLEFSENGFFAIPEDPPCRSSYWGVQCFTHGGYGQNCPGWPGD